MPRFDVNRGSKDAAVGLGPPVCTFAGYPPLPGENWRTYHDRVVPLINGKKGRV